LSHGKSKNSDFTSIYIFHLTSTVVDMCPHSSNFLSLIL
jgi:hypothetical protein